MSDAAADAAAWPVSDEATDAAWIAAARARLASTANSLAAAFDAGGADVDVRPLIARRCADVDGIVAAAWRRAMGAVDGEGDATPALFAVGGYGRGELFPQSDVDLLVLLGDEAQGRLAPAIARFVALLWDAGLPVGHALRSAQQTTVAARADITVLTSLLEARPLAASADAFARLIEAIDPAHVWPPAEFFRAKRDELRARHARFGDTADNLEPNLKEGPGGLRDLQTLRWMALRVLGTGDFASLIALGQLGADEQATLDRQYDVLARLRFGLHLVAGRREERLRFDHQKALAARLGLVDAPGALAVEQMMQTFYRSAGLVQRIGDRLLQRFEEQLEGEGDVAPVDAAFELRRGYLAARDAGWPRDARDVVALFAAWAACDPAAVRGLHSQTARLLAEFLPRIPAYQEANVDLRDAFMALLRGPRAVRTLTRMARLGVLGRWIPAFANVSGRMQFDLFHVYTVDQHTLAVLANIEAFERGGDERFSVAHEVIPRLRKPELLLLAALFHDIAKGRGGDHSELGAVDARAFSEAMGLPPGDVATVEWLVAQHLLMSITAQKQDIADPDVIHRFAAKVGDRERLELLYLLTCADIAGTSPKLWNAWKDRLLADLYMATRLALRRGLENPLAAAERAAETRAAAVALLREAGIDAPVIDDVLARMPDIGFQRARPDQIAWQAQALLALGARDTCVAVRPLADAGALEVFVHSPDRDGLFAAIVITLDRLGLAIAQARVLDGPGGRVFDSFQVVPADARRQSAADAVAHRLTQVLDGPLDALRPARRAQPTHLRHFRIVPRIGFDDVATPPRTLLSLVCTDRPGLLADVALVLREQRMRVHDARVATFGERAEDVFQITRVDADGNDEPLDEPHQQALHDALRACLDGDCP
ncbi:[protein-PII] uridylyltransferase [Cognatilysobacter segetis]|uniref:[protein-PII] uridylyltransferase n=1 Tax=Cognatilysobacter segetis TaxID=2492394 RepID=UPI00105E05E0|nr:[protein-PII] uridylyltransferase [Lysobacter segetis]